jgi:hypothetical protein
VHTKKTFHSRLGFLEAILESVLKMYEEKCTENVPMVMINLMNTSNLQEGVLKILPNKLHTCVVSHATNKKMMIMI